MEDWRLEATFPEKGPCQLARPAAITHQSVRLLNQNLKSLLKKEASYKDPAVLLFAAVRLGASASLHVEVLRNKLKIMEIKYCHHMSSQCIAIAALRIQT